MFYFLVNHGINILVRAAYAGKSGCVRIFFSKSGIPDTNSIRMVIVSGPTMVKKLPDIESAMIHNPHHCVTSPK
jgi:hypothetical protein